MHVRLLYALRISAPFLAVSLVFGVGHKVAEPAKDPSLAVCEHGVALLRVGKSTEALADFQEALRLNPRSAEARNGLGNAFVKQGRLVDALEEFREAIQLQPDYADAHFNLGVTLSQLGEDRMAISEYRAAIGTGHAGAQAHNNLALLLWKRNDREGAVAELRSAEDLDPHSGSIHTNLGLLLEDLGNAASARAEFQKAIQVNPLSAESLVELAILKRREGNNEAAEILLRKAIRVKPKNSKAHYELGLILKSKGDLGGAVAEFRTALSLDPNSTEAQYNLVVALARSRQSNKGSQPKGSATGQQLRSQDEAEQQKYLAEKAHESAVELAKQGNFEGARAAFLAAQRLDPTKAEYFYDFGVLELFRSDWPAAESQFRTALRLKAFYPDAHNNLGMTLWRLGDRDAAVREFHEAIRQMPTPGEYENLGLILEEMGDPSAKSFLTEAEAMRENSQ